MNSNDFLKELTLRPVKYQLFWLYVVAYVDTPIVIAKASMVAGMSRNHGLRVLNWGIEWLKKKRITHHIEKTADGFIFSFEQKQTEVISEADRRRELTITKAIEYLNKTAGKQFRTEGKVNRSSLAARLKEGFTAEDIKRVIDVKVKEWLGTSEDKYIRPQTLFGNKFEAYLNQKNGEGQTNIKKAGSGAERIQTTVSVGRNVARGIFPEDNPNDPQEDLPGAL